MQKKTSIASEFFKNPADLEIYSQDVQLVCVPTASGATSKSELPFFFATTNFDKEWPLLEKVHVVKHIDNGGFLVNESIYRVHLEESLPNPQLQWLVPGVFLINPGDDMSLLIPIVTIIEYNNKINKIRIYWDQGSVMDQLGLLKKRVLKSDTFFMSSNFQLPVLGKSQASKLAHPSDLNPLVSAMLDDQEQTDNEEPVPTQQVVRKQANAPQVKQSGSFRSQQDHSETQLKFEDTPPDLSAHFKRDPNRTTSGYSIFDGRYDTAPVVKRGQGNSSHIFETDVNFQPARKGIRRGTGSSISQIQFGSNENIADLPDKTSLYSKKNNTPNAMAGLNVNGNLHHSEDAVVGGRRRTGSSNHSDFKISEMYPVVEKRKKQIPDARKMKKHAGGMSSITFG